MSIEKLIATKKAVVFGLDNVLYPEKDYLLQVYYLFSEFMAYTLQLDAKSMIAFMQEEFAQSGSDQLFAKTAAQFDIPLNFEANFERLHQNARLPLKLLLYKKVLELLQDLVVDRKQIFLLVDGNPEQQLNKIRQMEWHGIEPYLKVYFTEEFSAKPSPESFIFILENNELAKADMLLVGHSKADENFAKNVGVDYLSLDEI
ncbi:MAG: HAD hydrolase-like protein [Pedobacter sp.]|nr:HAD hydrolase-like protein [Pedobacter sp.]MDQ8051394.1 HAD hydrolase-like protein [Pedobacter sp.]